MKKLLLPLVFLCIAITQTSCTKEYTCICYNSMTNTAELMQMTARNENKARNRCILRMDSENNVPGNTCDVKQTK